MILIVVVLLLAINPLEFLLGVNLTGIDFIIPFLLFVKEFNIRFDLRSFGYTFLLISCLFLSFFFSDQKIPAISLIIAILYYTYPFFLYSLTSSTLLSKKHLKFTANLFVLNFLIIRVLMFTDIDQKAFPMHDYAFSAALLTYSFLYFYFFERGKARLYKLLFISILLLSVLMLKTIFALIIFLVWDILRNKGLYQSIGAILLILPILYFSPVFAKIDAYYTMYYLNDNAREIPRNLMNLQAISFAWDYFPFGVGPGIFWGFPITLFGSDLYYELGFHLVEGLNPDKFHEVNYVFDVFWAGILGEGGITSLLLFVIFLYRPIGHLKNNSSIFYFFNAVFFLLIFQSLVLSILAQPLFLILVIVFPLSHSKWLKLNSRSI